MCPEIRKDQLEMQKQMLAKRIATIRGNKGYSQAELAKYLSCSINTIQRYESGTLNIPAQRLSLIAEFFETDLNSLLQAA